MDIRQRKRQDSVRHQQRRSNDAHPERRNKHSKWTGGVTAATSNEFTFTAAKKEVSGASGSSAENVTASWLIKYKKVDTNELKIVSDDIPNDTNDFDFSNATLFLRASE